MSVSEVHYLAFEAAEDHHFVVAPLHEAEQSSYEADDHCEDDSVE